MVDGTIRREHRFTVVPEHLTRDARVSDRAFRLWCILDRYAGADGAAFPLRQRLADDLQCSVATLDRTITELVSQGWMSKARRYRGGPNDYTVLVATTGTPVLTGEETPLVTDDETLSSPVSGPVLTGEAQKEPSSKEASEKDPRSARGTRLPEDWEPDENLRLWFREQEFATFINPVLETQQFKDYWRGVTGNRGTKLDWPATWRMWMRNAAKRVGYSGPAPANRDTATASMASDLTGRSA